MSILKLVDHLSVGELKERLDQQTEIRFFKQWQILNAVANNPGIKAQLLSKILVTSTGIVHRTVQLYNLQGADFMKQLQWGGRREKRSALSLQEEKDLLQGMEARSLEGQILTAKEIRKEVERKVGKSVSDDYLWDLFKRHGWKKKAPRPKHPKQDKAAQEEFKKNSLMQWQPSW